MLFLHGWGGSCGQFNKIINIICGNYKCLAVDFYGFGKTPFPNRALKLQDYTNAVKELIDHYDIKDFILVGHSFGGRVALDYVSRYDGVKKLVLIDSAGLKPKFGKLIKTKIKTTSYKLCKKLFKVNISKGSFDYKALSPLEKMTFVNIVNNYQDDILSIVKCKSLIIWGGADKETPLYMAKRLKRKIKESKLIVYPRAGHFPYLDEEAAFINDLTDFIL